MNISIGSRIKHAWNAFTNNNSTSSYESNGYYYRPDRKRFTRGNERSIVNSIYNRIALDVASIDLRHCRVDEEDRFSEYIPSALDECLHISTNIDQTPRAFIQDIVQSMFDEGSVAVVPIDTTDNPKETGSYDINTMMI